MRRSLHFKRASKRFLTGTRCKTPFEAVQSGIRTLEDWVLVLEEERIAEMEFARARIYWQRKSGQNRTKKPNRSIQL